jgi:imidazolonepropionase-like amidohydrolase
VVVVFRAARVWDATGGPLLQDGAVVVDNDRIRQVLPWSQINLPKEAEVHHFAEHTLLPGLIDCHVHVAGQTYGITNTQVPEAKMALLSAHALGRALRAGVTTMRDLGSTYQCVFALKDGIAGGVLEGPRLLVAGAGICMTGGHGYGSMAVQADGADACRRVAREQLRQGADVIKLMASGGAATPRELPDESQLTVEEMRAAVEEAHKAGRPATAHALPTRAILDAIEAGVDSIEHGALLDEVAIEALLEHDIPLVPTLSIADRMVSHGAPVGLAAYTVEKARDLLPGRAPRIGQAQRAGVRIAFGTDSGAPFHPLGDVVHEMVLLQKAGLTPEQVLACATRTAAATIRRLDDVGTLELGKLADLLVVRGNPLEDLHAMAQPVLVAKAGQAVDGCAVEPNAYLEEIRATIYARL